MEVLAVKITLAHEEVVVVTGYTPFRRTAIPIQDFMTLLNFNLPVYIVGDFNIKSKLLNESHNNKNGNQYNVLHTTGRIRWEGPYFPTFFKGKTATSPDKVFSNTKAYFNIYMSPGPETTSDHTILMVKI